MKQNNYRESSTEEKQFVIKINPTKNKQYKAKKKKKKKPIAHYYL